MNERYEIWEETKDGFKFRLREALLHYPELRRSDVVSDNLDKMEGTCLRLNHSYSTSHFYIEIREHVKPYSKFYIPT